MAVYLGLNKVNMHGGQPGFSPPNLQDKTVTPTMSQQIITADSGYDGLDEVTVNAMPSGTPGEPIATKGTVDNHSITVTPSVTNIAGYIPGGTITGTDVTVEASELVSGTRSISSNGIYSVTKYASVDVSVPGAKNGTTTLSSTSRTLTYSGLLGKPVAWSIISTSGVTSSGVVAGASGRSTSDTCYAVYFAGNKITYSSTIVTATIKTTGLTVNVASGYSFNGTYRLVYAY